MMIRILAALLLLISPAIAQTTIKATTPLPISIAAGLTYQLLVPGGPKNSLSIQNNNATDNCEILVGGPWVAGDTTASTRTTNGASLTAQKASIVLGPLQSYTRYAPFIPSDTILGTCTTTGDSLYADTQ